MPLWQCTAGNKRPERYCEQTRCESTEVASNCTDLSQTFPCSRRVRKEDGRQRQSAKILLPKGSDDLSARHSKSMPNDWMANLKVRLSSQIQPPLLPASLPSGWTGLTDFFGALTPARIPTNLKSVARSCCRSFSISIPQATKMTTGLNYPQRSALSIITISSQTRLSFRAWIRT
jgi:hypothetical protein